MEVTYNGSMLDLEYHSAPSCFPYLFVRGVPQKVKKEDEEFFRLHSQSPGSPFVAAETIPEQVVDAASTVVDEIAEKVGGVWKRTSKPRGKGGSK